MCVYVCVCMRVCVCVRVCVCAHKIRDFFLLYKQSLFRKYRQRQVSLFAWMCAGNCCVFVCVFCEALAQVASVSDPGIFFTVQLFFWKYREVKLGIRMSARKRQNTHTHAHTNNHSHKLSLSLTHTHTHILQHFSSSMVDQLNSGPLQRPPFNITSLLWSQTIFSFSSNSTSKMVSAKINENNNCKNYKLSF
jgi:hypothetical protein